MVTEKKREERARALKAGLDTIDIIAPLSDRPFLKWDIHASDILSNDIEDGEDESTLNEYYQFTDDQRNRLIAHARHDAAFAVFGVHDAFKEARSSRILSVISVWLNVIMLGILVYVFFL